VVEHQARWRMDCPPHLPGVHLHGEYRARPHAGTNGIGYYRDGAQLLHGAIDVVVPPDVRVVCDGDSIAGAFEVKRIGNTSLPANAPTLRISGTAYFGAVNIKIVDPNAPGWAEKLKATWESLKG